MYNKNLGHITFMYVFIKALATLSHVCKKYAHATRHQKG